MLTVAGKCACEKVIKRSRFIGEAVAATTEEEALSALAAIKKRTPDASHHCYAYCIGQNANPIRFSDDGEPQGTAGLPILEVIKRTGVTDILVVVTRYFGGTLLGAAGLCRAYTEAAAEAVAGMAKFRPEPRSVFAAGCSYSAWSKLEAQLRAACEIAQVGFGAEVEATLHIPPEDVDRVCELIREATGGAARLRELPGIVALIPVK